MSVLRNLEAKLTDLVEGTFGRVFKSEVRPVELARKLAREMDEHKTVSVSRTYVPNEYVVYLSPEDRARLEGLEGSLIEELGAYLLEHARSERLALPSRPQIEFRTDERLTLGEFGIQARLVRPSEDPNVAEPEQAGHGNTMIYSTAGRLREPVEALQGVRPTRALLLAEGRRHVIPPGGALVGRSRDCDVVLTDANVSRRHAEVRPAAAGTWTVADLGSTNGVHVNGRRIQGAAQLQPGDRIALGTAEMRFELD
ncbi:MAG: FHA domain-containing protein [Actinomycetota bacterium]|nr:FHA domain-containing protein [Actinomycetota bacterium]